jgi:UDP-glucuronate 4-epimerase
MIETIESVLGKKAIIDRQPEQPGDVPQTRADISKPKEFLVINPCVRFCEAISK